MKRSKILAVILAGIIMLGLAGCEFSAGVGTSPTPRTAVAAESAVNV